MGGKFGFGQKEMLAALKAPVAVCDVRSSVPILSHVVVTAEGGVEEVKASDGDIDVTVICAVAPTPEKVSVALPGKQLNAILRDLPDGNVELEVDEASKGAMLRAGRSRYRVPGLDPAKFPQRKGVEGACTVVEMEAGALKSALKSVDYAAARGSERPLLATVCVEVSGSAVQFVATDSRRLAVATREAKVDGPADANAPVPVKAVSLLGGLLEEGKTVRMRFNGRTAVFEIGEPATPGFASVATKLAEGKFPNWRKVVPKAAMDTAEVSREELLWAVRRVNAALMQDGGGTVRLGLQGETLEVQWQGDHGEASGTIEAKWSGKKPATASYNAAYLMEPLKASQLDAVKLNLDAADPAMSPLVLTSEGEGLTYVLMPIRET